MSQLAGALLPQKCAIKRVPLFVIFCITVFLPTHVCTGETTSVELATRLGAGGDLTGSCRFTWSDCDSPLEGLDEVSRAIWYSRFLSRISHSLVVTEIKRVGSDDLEANHGIFDKVLFRAERFAAVSDSTIDFPLPSSALLYPPLPGRRIEISEELAFSKRYRIEHRSIQVDTVFTSTRFESIARLRSKLLQVTHLLTRENHDASVQDSIENHDLQRLLRQRRRLRILGVR
jgi:hypothetical protein